MVAAGDTAVALESHDESGNAIANDGSAIWAEPGGRIEIATGRTTNPVRITIVRSQGGTPSDDSADEIESELFIPVPIILSCRGHVLLPSDLPPGEYALVIAVDGEEVVVTLIVMNDELVTIETSLEPGATEPDADVVPVIDFMILEVPEAELESIGSGANPSVVIAIAENVTTSVVVVSGFAPQESVVMLDASERVIGGGTADDDGRAEVAFLTSGLQAGGVLNVLGLQSGARSAVSIVAPTLPSTGGQGLNLITAAVLVMLIGTAMVATKRR